MPAVLAWRLQPLCLRQVLLVLLAEQQQQQQQERRWGLWPGQHLAAARPVLQMPAGALLAASVVAEHWQAWAAEGMDGSQLQLGPAEGQWGQLQHLHLQLLRGSCDLGMAAGACQGACSCGL